MRSAKLPFGTASASHCPCGVPSSDVGLQGAYATARVAPTDRLIRLPDDVRDEDAAALLFKGMTAEMLVRRVHRVEAGQVLLAQAAAGGVGQLVCRWASHLGATVIGVVGSRAKVESARDAGCAEVVVSSEEDFVERVRSATGGRGVDVVYESVGGDAFARAFEALRPRGLVVTFGQANLEIPTLPLDLLGRRSHYVTRPSIRTYLETRAELELSAGEVFEALRTGALKPQIGQRFWLSEAPAAHRALEARTTTGATVLRVD